MTDKQKFICNYLDKHMKGHNLDYGIAYLSLLAKTEKKSEKEWKKIKKINKT